MKTVKKICWVALLLFFSATAFGDSPRWLLVETADEVLYVMQGKQVVQSYPEIAIGRYGVTANKRRHDNRTPLGEFRVTRITRDTRFQIFIGLSYPNLDHARLAREQGWLSEKDWQGIARAERQHLPPPQDTPLGGYIGIHGIGEGDRDVHENFNWTNGCIALTNEQIERLATQVAIGTRVVIR